MSDAWRLLFFFILAYYKVHLCQRLFIISILTQNGLFCYLSGQQWLNNGLFSNLSPSQWLNNRLFYHLFIPQWPNNGLFYHLSPAQWLNNRLFRHLSVPQWPEQQIFPSFINSTVNHNPTTLKKDTVNFVQFAFNSKYIVCCFPGFFFLF